MTARLLILLFNALEQIQEGVINLICQIASL